jgi:uncharacterized protein YdaU (DUF1376 family)
MHYYQHHIGDFIKDTSFLTNEEIGIYMKLIWLYYDTEKPLPDDINLLCIKVNARNNHLAVENILCMYFQLVDEKWHHIRCDKEIAEYSEFCAKQKANGLKGGRPKSSQEKPKDNPPVSQSEPKKSLTTNHKPLTTNHSKDIPPPEGVDVSLWNDYLAVRKAKKSKITETALKGLQREATKANMTLQEVIQLCCEKNWVGFEAAWVLNKEPAKKQNDDKSWMFSNEGIVAKANELGVRSEGLSYQQLKDKCVFVMTQRSLQ